MQFIQSKLSGFRPSSRFAATALSAFVLCGAAHAGTGTVPQTNAGESRRAVSNDVIGKHGAPTLPSAARAARQLLDQVLFQHDEAGVLWARGATYKASFDVQGATYIPSLGAHAPRNFPVRLALASASVGAQVLPFDVNGDVARADQRVTIERGTIREIYDLGVDSMEQSFEIASRPAAAGDLTLEIAIESELAGSERADGFEFSNEHGAVSYGRAFVREADGSKYAVDTRLAGSRIQIVVPAERLERAQYPLVVDPIVSTTSVNTTGQDNYSADVAYDASTDRWLVCYAETFSATDVDAYAAVLDAAGNVLTTVTIDFTGASWFQPRVANNAFANEFLIVSTVGPAGGSGSFVSGVTVNAATFSTSGQFQISLTGSGDAFNVDVGGDPTEAPGTSYCVVWHRAFTAGGDTDILGRLVQPGGTPTLSLPLSTGAGTPEHTPTISKSNGVPGAPLRPWIVVWERDFSVTDTDIFATQIDQSGTQLNGVFPVSTSSADERRPSVSSPALGSNGTLNYVVTFDRQDSTNRDIFLTLMNAGTVQTQVNASSAWMVTPAHDQIFPAIDSDGQQFLLSWAENYSAGDYDQHVLAFCESLGQLVLSESESALTVFASLDINSQVCARRSGGGSGSRYMIAWEQALGSGDADVLASLYDGPVGGPKVAYCFGTSATCPCGGGNAGNGCPNSVNPAGANLAATGQAKVSADTLVLSGSGMPATTSCLYLQGTQAVQSIFGDGLRCAGGTVVRLGTKTNSGGMSQFPSAGDPSVSVRGMVPGVGGTRFYQAWYRNNANFCTSAIFNLTNGVQVTWLP
jgi:hypothetical protein